MIFSITIYSSARSSGHHQSDRESLVIFLGFLKMIKLLVILFIIYDGGFPQKYLTVNSHQLLTQKGSVIDLWLGCKYVSEGFLISVWRLLFHHTLLKEPLEVDLKWNPLMWNWLFFKNSFRWSKGLLHKKGEKFFVWSFSRCKKILFSKWVLSLFLLY